jgi:hypothetical protein
VDGIHFTLEAAGIVIDAVIYASIYYEIKNKWRVEMVEKDKVYKCLNPVGIQEPVEQRPLSPRLDKLDGKTIYLSVGAGGEQGILIPLVKKLPEKYPQVNWKISYAAPHATKEGSVALAEEEMKDADALIRGVVW